jgi:hypothetical protein
LPFFCRALCKLRHTLFQKSAFFLNVYPLYSAINLYMFMQNVVSITYESQNTKANVRIYKNEKLQRFSMERKRRTRG